MTWDEYFMQMVYFIAARSKDEQTHYGAVIVQPDNSIISTGYNSFPQGVDDNVLERQERPLKYSWMAHAERNAIYLSARNGNSTRGCRVYTNGTPCSDCGIAIVQAGIVEVITDKEWNNKSPEKWRESGKISLQMFKEVGIKYREITIECPCKYMRGKWI